jgi:stage V sporulation protein B
VSRKESLVRGAAALAVAGLMIKVSNLLVRVPLTRLIDSEGLGIYQMALPAFYALYHIAAGGLPVAVQNLVAEYTEKGRPYVAQQVLRLGLGYAIIAGGAATVLLLFGAPVLANMLGEERAIWSLMAVAPAVLLFAVDSIYRNYLQGRKLMTPSAVASLLEQATKIVVMMGAAYLLIPLGKAEAAGGASLGITAGALVSVLYMIYIYGQIRADDLEPIPRRESRATLIRRMLKLAWPVTVGNVTLPLLSLVDVGIVQRGFLKAGHAQSVATSLYGAYSGIAVQVIWFPFVLTNALGNALVPVLAGAKARKDKQAIYERVVLGLRAAALICLPVAVGAAILAHPIAGLFGDTYAAEPLLYMAPVAFLGPLTWLMIHQLQALGRTAEPMRNLGIAMVLKICLDGVLAPIPGIDVKGVAVASVLMFFLCAWLNARTLAKELDHPLPWAIILRGPLFASILMGAAVFGMALSGILPQRGIASLTSALAVAPVLYVITLAATRALTWEEFKAISGPVGPKLERWLHMFWPWS